MHAEASSLGQAVRRDDWPRLNTSTSSNSQNGLEAKAGFKGTTAGANAIRTICASGAQTQEQRKHREDRDSGQALSNNIGLEPNISYQIAPSPPFPMTTISPHELLPHSLAPPTTNEKNQEVVPGVPLPPYPQSLQKLQPTQLQPGFSGEHWLPGKQNTSGVKIDRQHQEQHDFGSRSSTVSPPASTTSQHLSPAQTPPISLNTSAPSLPNPGPSTWRRRLTKTRSLTTMAGSVKRSISTPNVQQAAAAAALIEPSYPTDKRRNKLGYHRTSVACGHCRRRKIRCLLQKDDAQGRCSNCIRLKKECTFYPVDATDRRPRSMSKPDINSGQEPTSEASSPSPRVSGQLQTSTEPPRGYASSVPVTPTYDFPGSFEDSFRNHNKISGCSKQHPMSRSTNVSRKSSLAQMHTPMASKMDQGGFLSPRDPLARPQSQWPADLVSHSENTTPILISGGFGGLGGPLHQLDSFQVESLDHNLGFLDGVLQDLQDDGGACYSQASSRVGSIDHGAMYSLRTFPSSEDHFPPALASASGSTASLTASLSEASQYGGDPPYFVQGWPAERAGAGAALGIDAAGASYESSGSPLSKQASFESASSWPDEDSYHLAFSAPVEMSM